MSKIQRSPYIERVNGYAFKMIYIKGGSFMMGDEKHDNEKPTHQVTLTDYWLGQYPVTQGLWKAVMVENPSYFRGDKLPVEQVSWKKAQEFIQKLNVLTEKQYSLPGEAQWEYAARGGIYEEEHALEYAGSHVLEEVGWWHKEEEELSTMPIGLKLPNALGLYDMSGNVYEWCLDAWDENFYQKPAARKDNPVNINYNEHSGRVMRGGSWLNFNDFCRVAHRNCCPYNVAYGNIGFRLCRMS